MAKRHRGGILTQQRVLPSGNMALYIWHEERGEIVYPLSPGGRLVCQIIGAVAVSVSIGIILAGLAMSILLGCL